MSAMAVDRALIMTITAHERPMSPTAKLHFEMVGSVADELRLKVCGRELKRTPLW